MTRLAPAGTSLKTKPKPQANTIENKKRAMLKKQSSEYAIVNVQGSIVTGIVKPIQVGGQRADERMPNVSCLSMYLFTLNFFNLEYEFDSLATHSSEWLVGQHKNRHLKEDDTCDRRQESPKQPKKFYKSNSELLKQQHAWQRS